MGGEACFAFAGVDVEQKDIEGWNVGLEAGWEGELGPQPPGFIVEECKGGRKSQCYEAFDKAQELRGARFAL